MSQIARTAEPVGGLHATAIIYLRVSTRDQAERGGEAEGFSIPAQREACLRKAEALGATVVEEFVDAGESAKSANRPDLQRLLRYIREQHVGYVIVHKIDRLARNRMDDVEIHAALSAAGSTLVSCTENIDETPSGMLLHGIMSSIAEFYSRNLATETRKGMRQKAKNGGTPGMVPFGYLNVRIRDEAGREIRTVVTDEERAKWVSWLYEQYATGEWTALSLRDELERRGVRSQPRPKKPAGPLSVSQIDSILKNRYYLGLVSFEGAEYPGKHEQLISEELFQRVQAVRRSRHDAREKPQVRAHYLKGSVYCGQCGEPLSLEYSRNRLGTLYRYFYCLGRQGRLKNGCTFRAVQVHQVEQLVEDHWASVTLSDATCQAIRELVWEHLRAVLPEQAQARERADRQLAALRAESTKLLQAHYADAISLDMLKAEQQRIALAKAGAERQLADAQASEQHLEQQLDRVLALLGQAQRHYLASNSQARRYLNQGVFERIYLDDDEVVGSDLTLVFQRVLSDNLKQTLSAERRTQSQPVGNNGLSLVGGTSMEDAGAGSEPAMLPARHRRAVAPRLANCLKFERPAGHMPWEQKNLCPRKDTGSNVYFLVAGTGFEPVTSGL